MHTDPSSVSTWRVDIPFDPKSPRLGKVDIKRLQFEGERSNEFEVWLVFEALPWLRRQVWILPRAEREEAVRKLVAGAGSLEYSSLSGRYSLEAELDRSNRKLVICAKDHGAQSDADRSEPRLSRMPYTVVGKRSSEPDAPFVRLTNKEFELLNQACSYMREIDLRRKPAVCFVRDVDRKIRQLNEA